MLKQVMREWLGQKDVTIAGLRQWPMSVFYQMELVFGKMVDNMTFKFAPPLGWDVQVCVPCWGSF